MSAVVVQTSAWLATLLALIGFSACVDVNGGAVELSWVVRTPEGKASNCDKARIGQIKVCWQSAEELAVRKECAQSRVFDCADQRGFSRFEIPEGSNGFWIEPLCNVGETVPDPATYEVPPPILRAVIRGQVVTLSTLLIVATDDSSQCGDQCTCGAGTTVDAGLATNFE